MADPDDDAARGTLRALGAALRERRRALGITMAAAAEAAGMSRVTWHRLENGDNVASRAWANAAAALGLRLALEVSGSGASPVPVDAGTVPLAIRPRDFPQLERLAWQLDTAMALTPREAWNLYQRNRRHLDAPAMTAAEKTLFDSLRLLFGDDGV